MTAPRNDFTQLLRDSMSLVSHIDTSAIPVIQRNIAQLDMASKKMAKTHTKHDAYLDSQAQMFLAKRGLDMVKHTRTLRDIDLSRSYEPLDTLNELDVDKFLEHQHTMLVNTAIEEATKLTTNTFRRHYISRLEDDWTTAKREILDTMGFRSGKTGISSIRDERRVESGARPSTLSIPQSTYASVITELNLHRHDHKSYPLIAACQTASTKIDEFYDRQSMEIPYLNIGDISDCWELIRMMMSETHDNKHIVEKQYATSYTSGDVKLRQSLINGAKAYSEQLFTSYMKRVISSNSQIAKRSGTPSLLADIYAYMNVIAHQFPDTLEDIKIDGQPLWCVLFFSLRCGSISTCLQVIAKALDANIDIRLFRDCVQFISKSQRIPTSLWEQLNDEYNREIASRDRCDPYRMVCYHLIGRFPINYNVDIYKYVAPTSEDYMWLKLSVMWESTEPLPESIYGIDSQYLSLSHFQSSLLARGEQHFNADGRRPLTYFKILLMSQQFEQALYYLIRTEYFVVAVHFSIALEYYGCVRKSAPQQDLLHAIDASTNTYALNYVRILRKYVESFINSHPIEAFHYLYLLHTTDDLSFECMKDLIVETKQIETLVGSIKNELIVKNGLLYRYYSESDAQTIIRAAASVTEQNGLIVESIQLYTLCDSYNQCIDIFLHQLARMVSLGVTTNERQQLIEMAVKFRTLLLHNPARTISEVKVTTLTILLKLIQFFDLYHLGSEKYDDALEVLYSLHLLPLTEDSLELENAIQRFSTLDVTLRRIFADVALVTMDIYYIKYESIRHVDAGLMQRDLNFNRATIMRELQTKARGLVNFIGMNQMYIGADINAKLVRTEAMMSSQYYK